MPMKEIVTLRPATIDDLSLLKYWDTQQHVIDCDPDDEWDWEKELPAIHSWREMLVAELNENPIGFIQIIDPFEEETHYWGKVEKNIRAIDIWIGEAENLGKGYGTKMMQLAIDKCFANPRVTKILIDPLQSNVKAQRFYEKIGFTFLEERVFDDVTCCVYELKRN